MRHYNVTGMSCAACSARVEKAVSAIPKVISCSVNLLTNSMLVEGDASEEAIINAVIEAGYGIELTDNINNTQHESKPKDTIFLSPAEGTGNGCSPGSVRRAYFGPYTHPRPPAQ